MASKPPKSSAAAPVHAAADVESVVEAQVLVIRGQRVQDFMFRLEREDLAALRSQTVTLDAQVLESKEFLVAAGLTGTRGSHAKYTSCAFTEQGVAMLSSILKSERAIAVNIEIMRTFVKLRGMLSEHADLKRKLNSLEKKYDQNFRVVFDVIHQLMTPAATKKAANRVNSGMKK